MSVSRRFPAGVHRDEPAFGIDATCIIVCVLLYIVSPASAEPGFDHQLTASRTDCAVCHAAAATAPALLVPNAGNWCVSCHGDQAANVHPMGIPASAACGLPLEPGGRINCLTCHSPHQVPLASEPWTVGERQRQRSGLHLTYLLPFRNTAGELCRRCHADPASVMREGAVHRPRGFESRGYAGSMSCMPCHADIYRQWYISPHARMTRRPGDVKDLPELTEADLEWPPERVKYVLGSHYVHRFVADATGTLVVLPRILDRATKKWLPVRDYGWTKRRWLEQCAGCHTTGFSADGNTFVEPGVGCEACHGPARDHARSGAPELVANPGKMPADRAEMLCMSCHTSGVDETGKYHFPVGYRPGDDLASHFFGLTPKPGQDSTTFAGDESMDDRRRQWQFLRDRLFLAKGLTCDYCQNFRDFKTASGGEYLSHDEYCMTCHVDRADHPAESPGQNCTSCHAPRKTASGACDIHDHKFRF